jgi:hypothetical protein
VPSPNTGFTAVAGGEQFSLGLKQDSSIVAWGWNEWGQCNVPPSNTGFIAIAAGGYHSVGLKYYCAYKLAGDQNDDCKVDFHDFAIMAERWLIDCYANPSDPDCLP